VTADSRTRHHIRFVCNIIMRRCNSPIQFGAQKNTKWAQGEGYSVSLWFGEIKKRVKIRRPSEKCVRHHQVDDAHFL
jgi:hypothetical protein